MPSAGGLCRCRKEVHYEIISKAAAKSLKKLSTFRKLQNSFNFLKEFETIKTNFLPFSPHGSESADFEVHYEIANVTGFAKVLCGLPLKCDFANLTK